MLTNINKWIIVKCFLNEYANIMLFLNNVMAWSQNSFFFSVLWFELVFICIFSI